MPSNFFPSISNPPSITFVRNLDITFFNHSKVV